MRRLRFACVFAVAAATLACGPTDAPQPTVLLAEPIAPALRPTSIADPDRHWERHGYVELASSAEASGSSADGIVRVWLRLPHGAVLALRQHADATDGPPQLRLPVGTVIERVETRRHRMPDGAEHEAVVDVRGVRIVDDGQHRWHVMRPASHAPRAPLLGWSWPVDDALAQAEATRRLERFLRGHRAPHSGSPIAEEEIARLLRHNECGRCHRPQETAVAIAPSSFRDGDAQAAGSVSLVLEPSSDERVDGDRDRDAFMRRVCATRRTLWRHIDAAGRRAFARSFSECGLR